MTLTEEQIAGLTSDMARRIESHDLFDVPDGAKYHTAANTIATDLVRCVVGPALEAANKRADEAEALVETLKREAQLHAQEARTANATIAEIYREVSGGKGEPGNWNGAEPVRAELTTLRARVAELEDCRNTMLDALADLRQWADSYPLNIFPEPDFARAAKALADAGMTIDAVSASNMRHVLSRVKTIADAALKGEFHGN